MGHCPRSFSALVRWDAAVVAVLALVALIPGLADPRTVCRDLVGFRGLRRLSDPLRPLSRQRDIRAAFRKVDDFCESVAASLRRSPRIGFSVRGRMRERHQKRVQAGAGLGIEVAAHVPAAGAFLAQPEFASPSLRAGVLGVVPVGVETREHVCSGHRDVARSRDAGEIDQVLLFIESDVRGDVLWQPPHDRDDSVDAALGQYAGGGRGSGQRRDGWSQGPVARPSRVQCECSSSHLLRFGSGNPGHVLVEDGDRVVPEELSDTA